MGPVGWGPEGEMPGCEDALPYLDKEHRVGVKGVGRQYLWSEAQLTVEGSLGHPGMNWVDLGFLLWKRGVGDRCGCHVLGGRRSHRRDHFNLDGSGSVQVFLNLPFPF